MKSDMRKVMRKSKSAMHLKHLFHVCRPIDNTCTVVNSNALSNNVGILISYVKLKAFCVRVSYGLDFRTYRKRKIVGFLIFTMVIC